MKSISPSNASARTHARREKSIRHGHISTLHIWWARRPLAACRAVICASLWPDPADEKCPQSFRDAAARLITEFAEKVYYTGSLKISASEESFAQWDGIVTAKSEGLELDPEDPAHLNKLRFALLDFIADFANWDNSTVKEYLETSRALTQAAHEALGGAPGTRPLVVDPFAGGGSIPLEALRVGADTFASDLNPVPVLLNKVVLEYIPKYGQRLADEVRKWGDWIQREAEKQLAEFYPKDVDGATPIAYLWARTIRCEGPGCGAEVPLVRSFLLGKRNGKANGLRLDISQAQKKITYSIAHAKSPEVFENGTLRRGSATCPICGYTVPGIRVRSQVAEKQGGADTARLLAVYCDSSKGRIYRDPSQGDLDAFHKTTSIVAKRRQLTLDDGTPMVPDEELPYLRSIFNINLIGVHRWDQIFSSRQLLSLLTLAQLVRTYYSMNVSHDGEFATAVATALALAVDRQADYTSSICTWVQSGEFVGHTFAQGQSLPIKWDFAEVVPCASGSGNWDGAIGWVTRVLQEVAAAQSLPGHVQKASSTEQPLPDDAAQLIFTDPPYYDAIPYADLSDFFYVWLKRTIGTLHPLLFQQRTSQKDGEIVQLAERNPKYAYKTRDYFEQLMSKALAESRRVASSTGLAVIIFAHKETAAWETMIQAVISSGWIVVASWPIDTEMGARLRARNSAALASSVHLVCRPRETRSDSLRGNEIGDWRDVLAELPSRIHEWMPRLASEGIVGADAIFACLGPALEIFSRYSLVERADGKPVALREYLVEVWAAVAKEALSLLFKDADASGLEPDSRLTAMWLWTLRTDPSGTNGNGSPEEEADEDQDAEDENPQDGPSAVGGYAIESDAARKIAQGLGANLDTLKSIVEVKGKTARLLLVSEREPFLFAKPRSQRSVSRPSQPTNTLQVARRGKSKHPAKGQQAFGVNEEEGLSSQPATHREARADVSPYDLGSSDWTTSKTVLDRVHQSMLLFARGRADSLKRFLADDGIGKEARFWKLAQALSALYPRGSNEKRWVDGVLARKKGLGL